MSRSCSSVAGPAALPAISYRSESSQSGPETWNSVTCQAQRIEDFRLTLRMVTVPGETWIFSRRLGPPAVPGWPTLTEATSKAGAGASADWPKAAVAAKRIRVAGSICKDDEAAERRLVLKVGSPKRKKGRGRPRTGRKRRSRRRGSEWPAESAKTTKRWSEV